MTHADDMRDLAASFVHELDDEGLARQRTEFRAALRAAAEREDALRELARPTYSGEGRTTPSMQDKRDAAAVLDILNGE